MLRCRGTVVGVGLDDVQKHSVMESVARGDITMNEVRGN